MTKLLLFDLDGTLMVTHGAGRRAMERAGTQVLGKRFSLDGVDIAGGLDPWIFAEAARRSALEPGADSLAAFREALERELVHELTLCNPGPVALPGILELLGRLRADPCTTLGLLTGNFANTGSAKLRSVGIDPDWFEIRTWGDEAPDRRALVALAMKRHETRRGRDVIVIGDTPRDVDCAQAHDCATLAVATGSYTMSALREAGADHVVENLRDPTLLWEMIRSQE